MVLKTRCPSALETVAGIRTALLSVRKSSTAPQKLSNQTTASAASSGMSPGDVADPAVDGDTAELPKTGAAG
jgi:hypothetical protein